MYKRQGMFVSVYERAHTCFKLVVQLTRIFQYNSTTCSAYRFVLEKAPSPNDPACPYCGVAYASANQTNICKAFAAA